METIFTKIINREIPATIVYEDEQFIAFLDIKPVYKGHTLLIPKQQYTWMQDVPDELLAASFELAKRMMTVMIQNLPCDYVQVSVLGEEIPHFHIHLIPRSFQPEKDHTARHYEPYENDEEKESYAQKISNALLIK